MVGATGIEPVAPASRRQFFLTVTSLNQPFTHSDPTRKWPERTGVGHVTPTTPFANKLMYRCRTHSGGGNLGLHFHWNHYSIDQWLNSKTIVL